MLIQLPMVCTVCFRLELGTLRYCPESSHKDLRDCWHFVAAVEQEMSWGSESSHHEGVVGDISAGRQHPFVAEDVDYSHCLGCLLALPDWNGYDDDLNSSHD